MKAKANNYRVRIITAVERYATAHGDSSAAGHKPRHSAQGAPGRTRRPRPVIGDAAKQPRERRTRNLFKRA